MDSTRANPREVYTPSCNPIVLILNAEFPKAVVDALPALALFVLDPVVVELAPNGDVAVGELDDLVVLGVGSEMVIPSSGIAVLKVPTVRVERREDVGWEFWVREVGMGRVRVREERGVSKEPVMPSRLLGV